MRREMQAQLEQQAKLQSEINGLQQQLADANQGLRAASRLSDQLEAGQQIIAVLRDEGESMHSEQAGQWILTNPKKSATVRVSKIALPCIFNFQVIIKTKRKKNTNTNLLTKQIPSITTQLSACT